MPRVAGENASSREKMNEIPLCTSDLARNISLYFLLPRGLGKEVSLHNDFREVASESGRG